MKHEPASKISLHLCHVQRNTQQTRGIHNNHNNVNNPSTSFCCTAGGWHGHFSNIVHFHKSVCCLSHSNCTKPNEAELTLESNLTLPCPRLPVRGNLMNAVWSGCHYNLSPPKYICHFCHPHWDASETLRLWKYRRSGGLREHQFRPWPGTNSAH